MAVIIGVVSQKGGSGKSTICRLVACSFAADGWDVKIADLDISQATTFHWHRDRIEIPLDDVKIVDSGWGTQLFETGALDVLGAFAYDEPITLELKAHSRGKTIEPEKYGVHYVGTVYFTRKALTLDRPDIVQSFMNALVEGWRKALDRPSEAMDLLAQKFESVRNNIEKERRSFDAGRAYFGGERGRILFAPEERWTEMAESLRKLGKLGGFEFNENVDYRFLKTAEAQ